MYSPGPARLFPPDQRLSWGRSSRVLLRFITVRGILADFLQLVNGWPAFLFAEEIVYTLLAVVLIRLFQHLAENDGNILELLSCESNGLFLRYFKESLNGLIRVRHPGLMQVEQDALPADFKINFVSSTFVETVLWWLKNQRQQTPEELAGYFMAVTAPIWEK